jgi:hypothetical protein
MGHPTFASGSEQRGSYIKDTVDIPGRPKLKKKLDVARSLPDPMVANPRHPVLFRPNRYAIRWSERTDWARSSEKSHNWLVL